MESMGEETGFGGMIVFLDLCKFTVRCLQNN